MTRKQAKDTLPITSKQPGAPDHLPCPQQTRSAIENIAIPDYHADPHIRKAGLIVSREHPGMGMADHLGVVPRLSGTPARVGRPTPVLGAETDEILAEAGYTSTEIAALKAAGAVVQHYG